MRHQKPRLLIAGGNHADIPLIRAGKQLGFHVITSGDRARDLGHLYADEYIAADFSDPEAMLQIAEAEHIQAICSCCNDFAALSAAYVAERLELPGHDSLETSTIIHHKDLWRKFAADRRIPSPKAIGCTHMSQVSSAVRRIGFPLIIKPVDLTGGKGIQRVENRQSAMTAAQQAFAISKAGRIVIEEFITGSRHGFTSILRDQRVAFSFTDDEHYHLSPYLVSGASSPSSCSEQSILKLSQYSELIASELGLVDGIFHVQFIERASGDPVIIEICRRAPGDLYVELVRHATGAPYAEWIVRAACGQSLADVQPFVLQKCVTRHCLMADMAGTFQGFISTSEEELDIIDSVIWASKGDRIEDPLTHKLGIVFIAHKDIDRLRQRAPRLQELLSARISP